VPAPPSRVASVAPGPAFCVSHCCYCLHVPPSPQVLRRKYGKEADIWSCGVMLYILLSGMPPFYGDNEQQIFDAILRNKVDFESDPWPKVSEPAKVRGGCGCVGVGRQAGERQGEATDVSRGVSRGRDSVCGGRGPGWQLSQWLSCALLQVCPVRLKSMYGAQHGEGRESDSWHTRTTWAQESRRAA
jgi:hypothetical protein